MEQHAGSEESDNGPTIEENIEMYDASLQQIGTNPDDHGPTLEENFEPVVSFCPHSKL